MIPPRRGSYNAAGAALLDENPTRGDTYGLPSGGHGPRSTG